MQIRRSFTLLELLVVISVIGILTSLLMCAVQQARAASSRLACQNNLRQLALALHGFHDVQGALPPPADSGRMYQLSWMGFILPYMDENPLWQTTVLAFAQDTFPVDDPPHLGYHTVVKSYVCPADGRAYVPLDDPFGKLAAYTNYLGIAGSDGTNGVFTESGISFQTITDGLSNTIMVGERPPPANYIAGRWYTGSYIAELGSEIYGPDNVLPITSPAYGTDPACIGPYYYFGYGSINNPCDRYHFWSLHPTGANFLFADGAVRFLSYSVAPILPALSTRSGGEVVDGY